MPFLKIHHYKNTNSSKNYISKTIFLQIVDGLCKEKEKISLPPTTVCVIVIEIDGNGIYKISVIDESVAKLIQQNDFEEIKCSARKLKKLLI